MEDFREIFKQQMSCLESVGQDIFSMARSFQKTGNDGTAKMLTSYSVEIRLAIETLREACHKKIEEEFVKVNQSFSNTIKAIDNKE